MVIKNKLLSQTNRILLAGIILTLMVSFIEINSAFATDYVLSDQTSCEAVPFLGVWTTDTCTITGGSITIDVGDTATVDPTINLIINDTTSLDNNGIFTNNGMMTVTETAGQIINYADFTNNGNFTDLSTLNFVVDDLGISEQAVLTNNGNMTIESLYCTSIVTNNGIINVNTLFQLDGDNGDDCLVDNYGTITINPNASFDFVLGGLFTNYNSLIMNGNATGDLDAIYNSEIGSVSTGTGVWVMDTYSFQTDGNFTSYDFTCNCALHIKGTYTNEGIFRNLLDMTVENTGEIVNNGTFLNDTPINQNGLSIDPDGLITNNGIFINNASAIINEHGLIQNNGIFTNEGLIASISQSTGIITNEGVLNNTGTITSVGIIDQLSIINNDELINSGIISDYILFTNTGIFSNSGLYHNTNDIFNEGTITNELSGTIDNDGDITNNVLIENSGTIINNLSSTLTNNGTINNCGIVINDGIFTGNSIIEIFCDSDNDSISNLIDIQSDTFSNDFSDMGISGTTSGTITTRGDQILTISEEPNPDGVRISADISGGSTPASFSVCDGASTFSVNAGDEVIVTCSSVILNVVTGQVIATFIDTNSNTATATIDQNSTLIFKPDTFTIESTSGTSDVTFVSDDGTTVTAVITEDNLIDFDAETFTFSAGQSNTSDIVISIDGETSTLSAATSLSLLSTNRDSFITQGSSSNNEGSNLILRIMSSDKNRPLVGFDQQQILLSSNDKILQSATLRMYITTNDNNWGSSGKTIGAYKLNSDWIEGNGWNVDNNVSGSGTGVTWSCNVDSNISNNQKDCAVQWDGGNFNLPPTNTMVITNSMINQWIEFDVTADVQGFLSGTNSNYGWLIKKTGDDSLNGSIEFASKESGLHKSELKLVFQE